MANAIANTRWGDSLLAEPFVQVDLLTVLPSSMDVSTWSKISFTGYAPETAKINLLANLLPDATIYQIDLAFPVPLAIPDIVAVGVSLYGAGLAVGLVTDQGGNPIGTFSGLLWLSVPIVFQNWVP